MGSGHTHSESYHTNTESGAPVPEITLPSLNYIRSFDGDGNTGFGILTRLHNETSVIVCRPPFDRSWSFMWYACFTAITIVLAAAFDNSVFRSAETCSSDLEGLSCTCTCACTCACGHVVPYAFWFFIHLNLMFVSLYVAKPWLSPVLSGILVLLMVRNPVSRRETPQLPPLASQLVCCEEDEDDGQPLHNLGWTGEAPDKGIRKSQSCDQHGSIECASSKHDRSIRRFNSG